MPARHLSVTNRREQRHRGADVVVAGAYPASLVGFRGPLLRAIADGGRSVVAVASERDDLVERELSAMHVEFRTVPLRRTGVNPIADVWTVLSFYRLLRATRPRVFLGYTAKPVIYGTLAAWLARVPARYALVTGLGYAFGEHRTWRQRLLGRLVASLYRVALSRATKVFFQNADDEALFRSLRLVPARVPTVVVNGSGVDTTSFVPAPAPAGAVSFLMVARLLGSKGVREYVAAASAVRLQHPHIAFRLAGWIDPGPDAVREAELGAWIDSGAIEFLGKLADVRPAIAQCSVFVLPSYREGTPRSVLEAMAMARAIITTDVPGCRQTVADGVNGLLVPARSAGELAEAMTTFIADPMLAVQMGRRSREIAEARYDVRAVNAVLLREMNLA